jgi:hypothetical protein
MLKQKFETLFYTKISCRVTIIRNFFTNTLVMRQNLKRFFKYQSYRATKIFFVATGLWNISPVIWQIGTRPLKHSKLTHRVLLAHPVDSRKSLVNPRRLPASVARSMANWGRFDGTV